MDSISSFLSSIMPEINEKLSTECEKLKMDYIKGLYYSGEERTEGYGGIDISHKDPTLSDPSISLFKQCMDCIIGIMQQYHKIPISFIQTSSHGNVRFQNIIIDTNFNIYYIKILPGSGHNIYTNVWSISISINNQHLYSSINEAKNNPASANVSYLQDYNIPKDCFYDTPLLCLAY